MPVRKSNKLYEDEVVHEIELKPGEYFKEFYIRKDKKDNCIYQLGFETNKNNKLMPGANIGDEIKGNLFGKNMVILGLSGDMNKRLNSIQVLYEDFEEWFYETYGKKVRVEYSCFGTNEELYNMLTIGDEYDLWYTKQFGGIIAAALFLCLFLLATKKKKEA